MVNVKRTIKRIIGNTILFSVTPAVLTFIFWLSSKNAPIRLLSILYVCGVVSGFAVYTISLWLHSSGVITITENEDKIRWSIQLSKEADQIAKKDYVLMHIDNVEGKFNGTNILKLIETYKADADEVKQQFEDGFANSSDTILGYMSGRIIAINSHVKDLEDLLKEALNEEDSD